MILGRIDGPHDVAHRLDDISRGCRNRVERLDDVRSGPLPCRRATSLRIEICVRLEPISSCRSAAIRRRTFSNSTQALFTGTVDRAAIRGAIPLERDERAEQNDRRRGDEPPSAPHGWYDAKSDPRRLSAARAAGRQCPHLELIATRREIREQHRAQLLRRAPDVAAAHQAILERQPITSRES